MELISEQAENYSDRFTSGMDVVLNDIASATLASHPHAHMLSGHVQGIFLQMISKMLKPDMILELGTFTGFSAICLAKGLSAGGKLHTIELRDEDAVTSLANIEKAGLSDKIKLHKGDAREIIPTLTFDWDLIFIDADKTSYIDYYELTLPRLKPGGIIIADNVLFHGQVLEEEIKGKNALAIHAFNEHVAKDHRVEQVVLTVRDGLMLIRKKN
jgi:predicted O-methyltransferase YrrM